MFFAGRLANYLYIDMDDCMRQALDRGRGRCRADQDVAARAARGAPRGRLDSRTPYPPTATIDARKIR